MGFSASFSQIDGGTQQGKVKLQLMLETGKTYYQNHEMTMDMTQVHGSQKVHINTTAAGRTLYRVEGETDSLLALKVTYDRMWMTMVLPNGRISFDSENPNGPNDVFSNIMAKMTKKDFAVEISRNGTVLSVDGLESIYDALFDDFGCRLHFTQLERGFCILAKHSPSGLI